MPVIPEGYLFHMESSSAILACKDRYELKRLLAKSKQQLLSLELALDFPKEEMMQQSSVSISLSF